ncbi:hypothetical protein SmJEL517_g05666 [Synchytrium microbalum]|uniref:Ubiquitin-like protease family profile domain-containing protein n=1 Tax=Synchytrium microbalum TaxID=1806994 RepID=A0A507C038_9FUNG|nr:uncharacterized protein SmJEL517_g05666 [Synchytrium microbalum]TPX30893.1 hypothetical protein SmJEL517_g05666 [Synchytrium microbalum]
MTSQAAPEGPNDDDNDLIEKLDKINLSADVADDDEQEENEDKNGQEIVDLVSNSSDYSDTSDEPLPKKTSFPAWVVDTVHLEKLDADEHELLLHLLERHRIKFNTSSPSWLPSIPQTTPSDNQDNDSLPPIPVVASVELCRIANYPIEQSTIERIVDSHAWLNDEAINAYLSILQTRNTGIDIEDMVVSYYDSIPGGSKAAPHILKPILHYLVEEAKLKAPSTEKYTIKSNWLLVSTLTHKQQDYNSCGVFTLAFAKRFCLSEDFSGFAQGSVNELREKIAFSLLSPIIPKMHSSRRNVLFCKKCIRWTRDVIRRSSTLATSPSASVLSKRSKKIFGMCARLVLVQTFVVVPLLIFEDSYLLSPQRRAYSSTCTSNSKSLNASTSQSTHQLKELQIEEDTTLVSKELAAPSSSRSEPTQRYELALMKPNPEKSLTDTQRQVLAQSILNDYFAQKHISSIISVDMVKHAFSLIRSNGLDQALDHINSADGCLAALDMVNHVHKQRKAKVAQRLSNTLVYKLCQYSLLREALGYATYDFAKRESEGSWDHSAIILSLAHGFENAGHSITGLQFRALLNRHERVAAEFKTIAAKARQCLDKSESLRQQVLTGNGLTLSDVHQNMANSINADSYDGLIESIDALKSQKLKPNADTFELTMDAFSNLNQHETNLQLYRRAIEWGITPTPKLQQSVIQACLRLNQVEAAMDLFAAARVNPSEPPYFAIIHGLQLLGRYNTVKKLNYDMQSRRIPRSPRIYSSLIHAHHRAHQYKAAVDCFTEARNEGLVDSLVYSAIMSCLVNSGEVSKAYSVWDDLVASDIPISDTHIAAMVIGLLRLKRIGEAREFVAECTAKGRDVGDKTMSNMLRSVIHHGQYDRARDMMKSMMTESAQVSRWIDPFVVHREQRTASSEHSKTVKPSPLLSMTSQLWTTYLDLAIGSGAKPSPEYTAKMTHAMKVFSTHLCQIANVYNMQVQRTQFVNLQLVEAWTAIKRLQGTAERLVDFRASLREEQAGRSGEAGRSGRYPGWVRNNYGKVHGALDQTLSSRMDVMSKLVLTGLQRDESALATPNLGTIRKTIVDSPPTERIGRVHDLELAVPNTCKGSLLGLVEYPHSLNMYA